MRHTHFLLFGSPHQKIYKGAEGSSEAAIPAPALTPGSLFPITSTALEIFDKAGGMGKVGMLAGAWMGKDLLPAALAADATIATGKLAYRGLSKLPYGKIADSTRNGIGNVIGWGKEGLKRGADFAFLSPARMVAVPAFTVATDTIAATGNFAVNTLRGAPEDIGKAALAIPNIVAGTANALAGGCLKFAGVFSKTAKSYGDLFLDQSKDNFKDALWDYNLFKNIGAAGSEIGNSVWKSGVYAASQVPLTYTRLTGASALGNTIQEAAGTVAEGGVLDRIMGTREDLRKSSFSNHLFSKNDGSVLYA